MCCRSVTTAGHCGFNVGWHFDWLFSGFLSCAQGQTLPPLLCAEWSNGLADPFCWLHSAPSMLAAGSWKRLRALIGLQACWPWAPVVLGKFRPAMNMSMPRCSLSTLWVCSFQRHTLRTFSPHFTERFSLRIPASYRTHCKYNLWSQAVQFTASLLAVSRTTSLTFFIVREMKTNPDKAACFCKECKYKAAKVCKCASHKFRNAGQS